MPLYEQIETDYKTALKAHDAVKVSVLRMVISAVKMHQIQKNLQEIVETDVVSIIQKQAKQRRESITQFTSGNRQDLAAKEEAELHILEGYLPKQLSDDELKTVITGIIAETGAASKKDMGTVMKAVKEKVGGAADGKRVSAMVGQLLG